jgi:tRNA A37 threonylcarbamoyladenosine synthetase subunit TsaC/SUA5/YrdC
VLEGFGGALLSHSVHVADHVADDPLVEAPDVGALLDLYGACGLDFVVDAGPRIVTASTVIDMTGAEPELVRQGAGDAHVFGLPAAAAS